MWHTDNMLILQRLFAVGHFLAVSLHLFLKKEIHFLKTDR